MTQPRRWWLTLVAIGAAALVLRLLHLAALGDSPVFAVLLGDSREYDRWAQEIAGGAWIGPSVFYQSPLYPYLIGIVYAIGGHDVALVRILQAIAGSLSCVLLGVCGRRWFGPLDGLLAAALLAIYPAAIFFDALIQKSSLDLLLMTASLLAIAAYAHRPEWRRAAGIGLALGLLTLNRENAGILLVTIAVWMWFSYKDFSSRQRAICVAAMAATFAAALFPVVIHNYAVGGEVVLTTSQLGTNFYIGNHARAGGSYESLIEGRGDAQYERSDATRLAEQALGRKLSATAVSRYWLSRAFDDIAADPLRWLRLLGRKLLLTINRKEAVDTESLDVHAEYSPVLGALRWLHFGVVFPIAAFGAWVTRSKDRSVVVLYAVFLTMALSVAAFYVLARYRFPLVPIVLLFAGAGLSRLLRGARTADPRSWRVGLAIAGAAAVLANLPVALASHDDTRLNIGIELARLERPAAAIPLFEQAIAESTGYPVAHYELGRALVKIGERRRAIEVFRTTVSLQPDHAEARMALAALLLESGNVEGAVDQATQAVRHRPDHFTARLNLGSMLLTMKQTPEAIPHLEHAVRIMPDSVPEAISALSLLAEAYRQAGRREDAIATLDKALGLARAAKMSNAAAQLQQTLDAWKKSH